MRTGDAHWRVIVESAIDGIITIDGHGLVQSFNPAAERLFGYRAAEVLGQNVAILMPPQDAEKHDAHIRRYLETRQPRIIGIGREVTGRRKDGTTFPMHLSVGEASIDGEITFIGIVRDLSERAALELRLREESALARIGEFAAVLAHEVKNPLAAVSGAIQMIANRLPAGSEEHQVSREVLNRLDALNVLMGDLLLYARPPRPNIRPVDLDDLLASLIAFLRSDPAWRELTVVVDGSAGTVDADAEMIKTALQNLLLNAVQAMRGRGVLRVAVSVDERVTHIDILDSGGGIPDAARERIFAPFFTTKAGGTGLGLATVKRIAESHGGRITLVSSSPTGTTMRLSLPSSGMRGDPWPRS